MNVNLPFGTDFVSEAQLRQLTGFRNRAREQESYRRHKCDAQRGCGYMVAMRRGQEVIFRHESGSKNIFA